MPKIKANGVELAYEVHGDAETPVLLLIHGVGTPLTGWPEPMVQALATRGHRIINVDNRDIGHSSQLDSLGLPDFRLQYLKYKLRLRPTAPYQLDDMASDALALLDGLGVEKAHLVGASMGGMISQLIAIRAPERVLSLTSIMSTTGNRRVPGATKAAAEQMLSKPASRSNDDVLAFALKTWRLVGSPAFPTPDDELKNYLQSLIDRGRRPAGIARHMLAVLAAPNRVPALKKLKVPTLVIHGDADPLVRVEGGIDTANAIPGAKLEIIEGMGHDLPPQLCGRIVDRICDHTGV